MTTARKAVAAGAGVLLLSLLGCPDWVNVDTPDVINPGNVANTDGAIAAYNGAIGAFSFMNDGDNGGTEGQISVSGMTADEYFDAETFPTRIEYDSRTITEPNGTLTAVFFNLSQARTATERAAAGLIKYAPSPASRVGEMYSLSGFTYIYYAENYCSGVPIDNRLDDGSLAYGNPLTTNNLLDSAIARFNTALTYDTGATAAAVNQANLARVGLGRALLDQGNKAAAAAAVAAVPTNFRYFTVHSSANGREFNGVFVFNNQAPLGTQRFSVANLKGGNGLNYRAAADPRVTWVQNGKGFDNVSPLYVLTKYTANTSPVQVASGVEARLIQAEAQGGAAMITSLNTLRADNANNGGFNLAPLVDPGTAAGQTDLLFRERAFWMFATGHRLGDLRRLVRQYARTVATVYPTGGYAGTGDTFFKGGPPTYGTSTELTVPQSERNNPNFQGCDYTTP